MFRKWAVPVLLLLASGASAPAGAQEFTVVIDRDIRVFTVVAALNAAGFDVELAPQYHPVRQEIRNALASLDPALADRLREFYSAQKGDAPDENELAKYISLALNLTDPPGFAFANDQEFTPPDARRLAGFIPLLEEFYGAAGVSQVWTRLTASYNGVLDEMTAPLRDTVLRSDAYLRAPPGVTGGRRLVIYLELGAPVNSVNVRNYSDNLYIVLGYSASVPVEDVRHAYLHLLLDDVVARSRADLREKRGLGDLIAGVEGVSPEYAADFDILVAESLIQAVEMRMDGVDASDARSLVLPAGEGEAPPPAASGVEQNALDAAYRRGLLLAPHFYRQLVEFEQSQEGIRRFFPGMIESFDLEVERQRFTTRFVEIPATVEDTTRAEVPIQPRADPVRALLLEAQEAFNTGEDLTAESAFLEVLTDFDSENGPALYGLGLIASREGDPDLAREYFTRTLDSASAEPSMRVWSHIYLGRIRDIGCDREAALAQYRAALEVGDDTRNAQAVARAGLETPFGVGCDFR